jgi:hypothetical protein
VRYERLGEQLLSRTEFLKRVATHFLVASGAVGIVLTMGVVGYHITAHLSWIDSLLNASMILGGMGPISPLQGTAAKLFASFYALFCGLVFVGLIAIVIAPFAHRLMHRFHMEEE